jgi:hypothetical protein
VEIGPTLRVCSEKGWTVFGRVGETIPIGMHYMMRSELICRKYFESMYLRHFISWTLEAAVHVYPGFSQACLAVDGLSRYV